MQPTSDRSQLLAQLASLTSFDFGTLAEEFREVPDPEGEGTLRRGPYFKHQRWQNKKNHSSRVPAQCVDALREQLQKGQQFDTITQQLRDHGIASARAERQVLVEQGAVSPEIHSAKKNSKKNASKPATQKPKPSLRNSKPKPKA
jgi:hypothetical protein